MNNWILSVLASPFFILQTNVAAVNLATNRLRSIGLLNRYLSIFLFGTFSLFAVMNEKYFNGAFSVRFNFH